MRLKTAVFPRSLVTFLAALLPLPALAADAEIGANGVFLVAKREMLDPRFREAVVLVTQPRRGGPWGVVINKPLGQRLSEAIPDHDPLKRVPDVLYYGGPVAPQVLVFLVRASQPPPRSVAVLKDVFFVGDTAWIDRRLGRPEPTRDLRVYAGYAGWGAGQLQNEIRRGDWHVMPADAATIFERDPGRIWPELIERATTKQTRWSRETGNVKRETNGEAKSGSPIHDLRFTIHEGYPPVVPMLAEAGL